MLTDRPISYQSKLVAFVFLPIGFFVVIFSAFM